MYGGIRTLNVCSIGAGTAQVFLYLSLRERSFLKFSLTALIPHGSLHAEDVVSSGESFKHESRGALGYLKRVTHIYGITCYFGAISGEQSKTAFPCLELFQFFHPMLGRRVFLHVCIQLHQLCCVFFTLKDHVLSVNIEQRLKLAVREGCPPRHVHRYSSSFVPGFVCVRSRICT